ncbi:MAG: bifunctional proline dehydrogenase/L-glutamate gamma-semialdehyde dehydrogenase PutA [Halomonadaceae bacterium]|nr:MAG: bifunctional proline dehydrogenase/L-glutamate gamma-semialdehyde dehydrogenase PutA [Halomonadaceae bacterium]
MFDASRVLNSSFNDEPRDQLWQGIINNHFVDETAYLESLMSLATPDSSHRKAIEEQASAIIRDVRDQDESVHMVDALLQEYSLDTEEGVLLMCLAEALMRIPDSHTADALIKDKMGDADWKKHMGRSESVLVNASTWGMLLTGKVVKLDSPLDGQPRSIWKRLINRAGEPVIRKAMYQAMGIMGRQFVLGRDIDEALDNGRESRDKGYSYSFDMLGEAALTQEDADKYFDHYWKAIEAVGNNRYPRGKVPVPSVSIKLSALHFRYHRSHQERVHGELVPTVRRLVKHARGLGVPLTVDAEEMDRLELSLEVFAAVYQSEEAQGWGEFGLAVQGYSKLALPVLSWLNALSREQGDLIPVRLVKGAYWDTEIKHCQQLGTRAYPVFTRKEGTDLSYLACARYLLSPGVQGNIYPQFASHNAHTVASVLHYARQEPTAVFEFQRLHGMGDALYGAVMKDKGIPVRIYAPVGAHKDLLPYLVRRLLENGANSSFVHRVVDAETPIEDLVQHPVTVLKSYASYHDPRIPLPQDIYGKHRRNSKGQNLMVLSDLEPLVAAINRWSGHHWTGAPIINGKDRREGSPSTVANPADRDHTTGQIYWSRPEQVTEALELATAGSKLWRKTAAESRAQCLERFADLMEANHAELMALCTREAGKTLQDGIDEVREAVDFCRYYANQARDKFAQATPLPGPTGESNEIYLEGRGVFLCISPWNFPLAIFAGQIMAALAAGNAVLAKPAEQTSLVAHRAVQLMLEAGFPPEVIQLLPGDGAGIGKQLLPDARVSGVTFTGSTGTAHVINRALAAREGAIVPLIAETGGQNAMIVDSSALPEQVVRDVLQSAFASAGQRCSALRVLYVQEDVADTIETLLVGAMKELHPGNPAELKTDVGPVIDEQARELLNRHCKNLRDSGYRLIGETPLPKGTDKGCFVAPQAFAISSINDLKQENFGPILHVVRYKARELDRVIDEINEAGYGLTLGIHSRSESTAEYIESRVRVGNTYINRNQIGAVVGVQPFGGQGLSGTGPKAGGPHYLLRFATERTRTNNTTAVGGNATLLSLGVETLSVDGQPTTSRNSAGG